MKTSCFVNSCAIMPAPTIRILIITLKSVYANICFACIFLSSWSLSKIKSVLRKQTAVMFYYCNILLSVIETQQSKFIKQRTVPDQKLSSAAVELVSGPPPLCKINLLITSA